MAFKAAIRAGALTSVGKGKGRGSIAAAESHAKREDPVAKRRSVRASPPVALSKAEAMPSFLGSGPLDYVAAFAAHKRETGAGERKRAGRCQLNSLAPRKWPVLERQMLAAPFQASKASIR